MTELPVANGVSHFVQANGVRLHYLDHGTAGKRPMLCVHGGAAHARWFDYVAPGFTADHRVLALDLRGHGDSEWAAQETYAFRTFAADIHAFVEQLDLRDFVLVGHSMGGMVSLVYASTYPQRLGKLVIVDSTMLMPLERVNRMRTFGTRPANTFATQAELVARYRLEPSESQMAAPEVIQRMATYGSRQNADGRWQHKADRRVYANFEQIAGMPLWDKIKAPTLAIKGERSTRFLPDILAEIRAKAPQVQMAEVPASDHHIMLDNPRGFVDAVQPFLRAS